MPPQLTKISRRLPARAMFSGRTAAWLHGQENSPGNLFEVTLPMNSRTSRVAGARVTRSDFSEGEVSTVMGLRVTSRLRTVVDVARRLTLAEAVAVLDQALHRRLVKQTELRQWIATHHGYRGIRTLRAAIELVEPATESPMETRLRMLLVLAGLPRPKVQVPIHDAAGIFVARPDLYYPIHRLAIEYDGATHRENFAADNWRQNRILESGHRILRFTATDVLRTPAATVLMVRRALAAAPNS